MLSTSQFWKSQILQKKKNHQNESNKNMYVGVYMYVSEVPLIFTLSLIRVEGSLDFPCQTYLFFAYRLITSTLSKTLTMS